jgi:hypothetical protein
MLQFEMRGSFSQYATRWLAFALLASGTACGSYSDRSPTNGTAGVTGAGGNAGTAGRSGAAGGVGGSGKGGIGGSSGAPAQGVSGSAGAGGDSTERCPEAPTPRLAAGTVVELPLELTLDGAPLIYAEANPVPGGGTLTPVGVRFYISEVALLRDGAEPLPVDVVTPAGTVAPYGVHFFNADDDSSTTLRVLAPIGDYQGIAFLWGLAQPCNERNSARNRPPLSHTSEMNWTDTGFLFFRYEGRTEFAGQAGASSGEAGAGGAEADGAGAAGTPGAGTGGSAGNPSSRYPSVIHMGGNLFEPLAPWVRVEGGLSVPAVGPIQKGVRVAMEQVFAGALADVDLTGFMGPPGEEVLKGERLRRSLGGLTVFSFEP